MKVQRIRAERLYPIKTSAPSTHTKQMSMAPKIEGEILTSREGLYTLIAYALANLTDIPLGDVGSFQ